MDSLSYFSLLIISFLGLFVGLILSRIAFEELKDGKKYFIIIQLLLWIIIVNAIIFYYNSLIYVIMGVLLVVLIFILKYIFKNKIRLLDYIIMGILFYYSAAFPGLLKITTAAIFLYGFPTASLIVLDSGIKTKHEVFNKKIYIKLLRNLSIILTAGLLYLLF
jgi:hypothetical protein